MPIDAGGPAGAADATTAVGDGELGQRGDRGDGGDGYSGRVAAAVVGITYRQLDYWARTDLVRPSLAEASGSGSRRRYSYLDLLELKVVKTLLDAGIKLESVRQVFRYLRDELGGDVASANLVISGTSAVLVRDGEDIIDLLRNGQGVLNVLPLAGVVQQVDAGIVRLLDDRHDDDAPPLAR